VGGYIGWKIVVWGVVFVEVLGTFKNVVGRRNIRK